MENKADVVSLRLTFLVKIVNVAFDIARSVSSFEFEDDA